jgi:hypothetical protein
MLCRVLLDAYFGTLFGHCSLVVRIRGYKPRDPGSISGATRFCDKQLVWNGVHSASWVQLSSYLEEKVAAPLYETDITAVEDPPSWSRDTPL